MTAVEAATATAADARYAASSMRGARRGDGAGRTVAGRSGDARGEGERGVGRAVEQMKENMAGGS